MIVAVTGGTGFIGRRLVSRLLAQGCIVRLLTRQESVLTWRSPALEIRHVDLLTANFFELKAALNGVEILYHCAGQIADNGFMRALHVDATCRLAQASSGLIRRWVHLSSVGVYGSVASGVVTEQDLFSPRGEYEVTKAESELSIAEIARANGFEYTILRPSNVYGAMMTNHSLYQMINMLNKRLFFFIGKGGASANYIHVDNVVHAMLLCGSLPQASGQAYNLSDHRTIECFVGAIAGRLGVSVSQLHFPEPLIRFAAELLRFLPGMPLTPARIFALTGRAIYSNEKIKRELGYDHVISMEDGLCELVDFWRSQRLV